jgi:hypothetical protein
MAMPRVAAIEIAKRAAPALTRIMLQSFDAGQTVFGAARPLGTQGNILSLVVTGKARAWLHFNNDGGSRIRAVLPIPYGKYLVGKYTIMPIGNQGMPIKWRMTLDTLAAEVLGKLSPSAVEVGATQKRAA